MATTQPATKAYSGEYRHALDAKKRITIPSDWRFDDITEFFLRPDRTNTFLHVMPPAVFTEIPVKLALKQDLTEDDKSAFLEAFYSSAQRAVPDKQGRLVLPEHFCKRLKLDGEVLLAGSYSKFHIWNPDAWDKAQKAKAGRVERVEESLGL